MSPLQQKLLCAYSLLHTAAVSLAVGPTPQSDSSKKPRLKKKVSFHVLPEGRAGHPLHSYTEMPQQRPTNRVALNNRTFPSPVLEAQDQGQRASRVMLSPEAQWRPSSASPGLW